MNRSRAGATIVASLAIAACGGAVSAPPPIPASAAANVAIATVDPSSVPDGQAGAPFEQPPVDLTATTDVIGASSLPAHDTAACTFDVPKSGGSVALAATPGGTIIGRPTDIRSLHVEALDLDSFYVRAETAGGTLSGFAEPLSMRPLRPIAIGGVLVAGTTALLDVKALAKGSLTVAPFTVKGFNLAAPLSVAVACDVLTPAVSTFHPPFTEAMAESARTVLSSSPTMRRAFLARKTPTPVSADERGKSAGTIVDAFDEEVGVLEEHGGRTRIAWTTGNYVVVGWVSSADLKRAPTPTPPVSARDIALLRALDGTMANGTALATLSAGPTSSGALTLGSAPTAAVKAVAQKEDADARDAGSSRDPAIVDCPVPVRAFARDRTRKIWLVGSLAPGPVRILDNEDDTLARVAPRAGLGVLSLLVPKSDLAHCTH